MFKTKGIVIKSLPFQEDGKIIQLFTPEFGIISVITKNISEKRLDLIQSTTPLFEGYFHLKRQSSEFYKLLEVNPISHHLMLKESLVQLKYAFEILKTISSTQPKNKPLPLLYQLVSVYLNELEKGMHHDKIISSFYLKFLRHEGLLNIDHFCEDSILDIGKIKSFCYGLKFEEIYQIEITNDEIIDIQNRFKMILTSVS